jgi:hypothetical protein
MNIQLHVHDNAWSTTLELAQRTSHRSVCLLALLFPTPPGSISDTLGMDLETLRGVNFLTLGESTPSGEVIKYLSLPTVWQQVCSVRMHLYRPCYVGSSARMRVHRATFR